MKEKKKKIEEIKKRKKKKEISCILNVYERLNVKVYQSPTSTSNCVCKH